MAACRSAAGRRAARYGSGRDALRAAAAAADGHEPLLAHIRALAQRARIPLHPPPDAVTKTPLPDALAPYGLTERELTVLQLVTAGRTNAQIGAELFISPGPPVSMSLTSCASSACPTGCRPPPSPNAPGWPAPGRPKHRAPESKHPPARTRPDRPIRIVLP